MKARQGFRKGMAFLLMAAMVFGAFGLAGWSDTEVYAATDSMATVRIIGENNEVILENTAVAIESGVTTLDVVVASACQSEGRTFELNPYGFPASVGGVTLGEGYSWMSMLNDSGAAFSTGDNFTSITAHDGDRIVLYADSWPSVVTYSFLTVAKNDGVIAMPYGDISYITGSVTLKLQSDVWGTVAPCAGKNLILTDENGTALSTASYDFGLPPDWNSEPVTGTDGTIKIDLYGSCSTADEGNYEKIFFISTDDAGLVKSYCKIVLTASGMTFSQPVESSGSGGGDSEVFHGADISGDVAAIIEGIRDVGDSHEAAYYDNDWALGMAVAGAVPTPEEMDNYLTGALDLLADENTSAAAKAKTALALTAFNIDARQVPNKKTGETIDLIKVVADSNPVGIDAVYAAPFMLSLYDLSVYEVPSDARVTREVLIETIMAGQGSDYWGAWGADGTGTVLLALAPYYGSDAEVNRISTVSCGAITAAVNDAVAHLSSAMGEYGGFPGYGGSLNANTQAIALTGLHALGIDTHDSEEFCKTASAMDNLLSYRTDDDKLGYADNTAADVYASRQGLWALATYQNLKNNGNGCLYDFPKSVETYTEWPDTDLLTGISVTTSKTQYNVGESIDPATITVSAIYNGDSSTATPVDAAQCTINPAPDAAFNTIGNATVTINYLGQKATYVVNVTDPGSTTTQPKAYVSVKIKDDSGKTIASQSNLLIEAGVTTVLDALRNTADNAGVAVVIIGGSYVSEINGLGEFELGENAGWLYKVNGVTPPTTPARQYYLAAGDEVLWYYTEDYTTDSSSSAWAGENAATIGFSEFQAKESGGTAVVSITKSELSELAEVGSAIKITSTIATIEMDAETVLGLSKTAGGNLDITASKLDLDSLANISEDVKNQIGERPVIDLSIESAGKTISKFDGEATVNVPYTLAAGENPNAIIMYLLNDMGKLDLIKASSYDEKTKTLKFDTDHFSVYAVGHNLKGFKDIEGNWAADPINYLAARELISGMSDTVFAPDANITRAQFVQLLANMAEMDLTSGEGISGSTFKDVNEKAWYSPAVAWAVDEKIVLGYENTDGTWSFDPNGYVTRQDMAVLLMRYMSEFEGVEVKGGAPIVFADEALIAGYAKGAIDKMSAAGVINGKSAEIFAPSGKATRSEAAKMIYVLYSQYM